MGPWSPTMTSGETGPKPVASCWSTTTPVVDSLMVAWHGSPRSFHGRSGGGWRYRGLPCAGARKVLLVNLRTAQLQKYYRSLNFGWSTCFFQKIHQFSGNSHVKICEGSSWGDLEKNILEVGERTRQSPKFAVRGTGAYLGGGFKYFLCSPLVWEIIQFR